MFEVASAVAVIGSRAPSSFPVAQVWSAYQGFPLATAGIAAGGNGTNPDCRATSDYDALLLLDGLKPTD
jgi:hypothetical protein